MIVGLVQPWGETFAPPVGSNKVIGVVCSGNLAVERDQVKAHLERGIAQHPEAVWVCCEKKSDAMTRDLLLQLGVDPVVLPMNRFWASSSTRRVWRDGELLNLCDSLVVFHKQSKTKSPWVAYYERKPYSSSKRRIYENLYLVEVGND